MATEVKKTGYELSRELEAIKARVEQALSEGEGELTPELERELEALETLEGEAQAKVRAYQFVWQTIAAEQAAAEARKGFHKDILSRYDRTVKALDEAGKRLKHGAARLLRLIPEHRVKIDGRSVTRRLFFSVEVSSPELAAEALKGTRCVKSAVSVDARTWQLAMELVALAKPLAGQAGDLAWAIDERLADEPALAEHRFDKAAIKELIDLQAYERTLAELAEAEHLAGLSDEAGDEEMLGHYENESFVLRAKLAGLVPAGVAVSVNETVAGF
jgi:hypothetical protein